MGLDVGGKRTGVAISDELGLTAMPVGFVARGSRDREEFRALIERYGATRFVAGLPAGMSGAEGPQAAEVRSYADGLSRAFGLELVYWDERLTTTMAERVLVDGGMRREKRRTKIDAVAAAIMLQSYLDAERNRQRRRDEM